MSNQDEINKSINVLKGQFPTTTFETALYCDSLTEEVLRHKCFWPKRLKKLKRMVEDLGYDTGKIKFWGCLMIYKKGTHRLETLASCYKRRVSIREGADTKLVEFLKTKYQIPNGVAHYQKSCSVFTGNKKVPTIDGIPTCPKCGGTEFVRALV